MSRSTLLVALRSTASFSDAGWSPGRDTAPPRPTSALHALPLPAGAATGPDSAPPEAASVPDPVAAFAARPSLRADIQWALRIACASPLGRALRFLGGR